jgi:hypothetical protein
MITLSSSNMYNVGFAMGASLVSTGSFLTITGSDQYVGRLRFSDSSLSQCTDTLIVVNGAFSLIMDSIAIFTSTNNGIVWTGSSSGYVSNITSTSGATNQAVINIQSGIMDGCNWSLQGTGSNSIGIRIDPGNGQLVSESVFSHMTLDSFAFGLFVAPTGTGMVASLTFCDFRCSVNGSNAIFTGPNVNDIILSNWSIGVTTANTAPQFRIDSGQGYTLDTINIINGTAASGFIGVFVSSSGGTTTGLAIHNCRLGYLENGTPDSGCTNALWIATSSSDRIIVTNNQLGATVPLLVQATGTHQWYADNQGVDDAPPTITSAATIALPLAGSFVLNGGTGVTAVTSIKSAGNKWSFTVGTSTTFTTGASIGNTITITKWGQIYWDGTKAWIMGV